MEAKMFEIFRDPVPTVPFGSISAQTDITWDSSKEEFTNGECPRAAVGSLMHRLPNKFIKYIRAK